MASRIIGTPAHSEVVQGAARDVQGAAAKKEIEVRACEQVVSATLNTITTVLQQVRTQGADCSSGEGGLSQAWEVGEHHLSRRCT